MQAESGAAVRLTPPDPSKLPSRLRVSKPGPYKSADTLDTH
jgi:hypothetical protein